MPEAAVNEDSKATAGKDDVGSHPLAICLDTMVLAEAGTSPMEGGAKTKLGTGVRLAVGDHRTADARGLRP